MNVFNCLRSGINFSTLTPIKRSQTICYRASGINNDHNLRSNNQISIRLIPQRCFMKKMGLKPIYDVYKKKAAKDNVSSTDYELVYNGTGEKYVRYLSGILSLAVVSLPSVFVGSYVYLLFTNGYISLKTYFDILCLPQSAFEVMIFLLVLFILKIGSYGFISKYVLRIYRHNMKMQHACVYIHPIFPWKNITTIFDKAIKLPDGKNFLVPWHKEYYQLGGYKAIVLRERFRRPIDYDRMLGKVKTLDENQ